MTVFDRYGGTWSLDELFASFGACEGCSFTIYGNDLPVRWGVLAYDDAGSWWFAEDLDFQGAFTIAMEASRRGGRFAGIKICAPPDEGETR